MNNPHFSRLASLRQVMQEHGVAACIIPTADPHLSEYLPEHWQARTWLSGFDGSSGTLVVSAQHAGLWTDSRYFDQAERQLQGSGIELMKLQVPHRPEHLDWLIEHVEPGATVAVAGDSVSWASRRSIERRLAERGAGLRTDLDLPGLIWPQRPGLPLQPVVEHPLSYAGASRTEKLARLRSVLRERDATHHLISSLDDIAWLSNLRGRDVECNPVFLAHLLVAVDGPATLFVARNKFNASLVESLAADGWQLADYADLPSQLAQLPEGSHLLLDPARVVESVAAAVPAVVAMLEGEQPSSAFKAVKSPTELAHVREVMRRDGAALVRAFRQLEDQLAAGATLSELDVDRLLREARGAQPDFVGESFATIAGYRANGALPHYRATVEQHSLLRPEGLLLIDSGGQYLGGTTDITRVLALGPLSDEERHDSSLVLKGMVALSRARFPRGASGPQLDALARAPLWAHAMDYGHGTGHGVGYFLNVHEGPQDIRPPRPGGPLVALEPGMISSIEPGLYRTGRHGIRHENLAVVVPVSRSEFGEFLGFETLTLCPFDRRTLDLTVLGAEDCAWLDRYHAQVHAALAPLLSGPDLAWLERHCAPLQSH